MSNPTAFRRAATASAVLAAVLAGMATTPGFAETRGLSADLSAARESLASAWSQSALSFTAATFTQGKARGYGRFTPKPQAEFAPDEPLYVYAEPVAFGYGSDGDRVTVELTASSELRNTTGQILAKGEEFARLKTETRHPVREFPAILSYRFDGLAPGDYVLVTRLDDANSDKSGSFSLPFSVEEK
ncbi:hypothetical protein [Breoghania sp.]|uniref:hypothetical protein n=1 Tax=Breoghania sp. TaxID=2065378 RepID=UPI00260CEF8E|nr:hypothetical protein [Breoghania sp.]MDJ0930210.1 hypothetical protein [Breoghania sp.]